MKSLQNHLLLQNLYRLKALGYKYIDPILTNQKNATQNSSNIFELNSMIENCHLCDLNKSRTQSMSGFGNIKSKIFFIDSVVSMSDDSSNSYFSANVGEIFKNMVEKVLLLDINDIYYTHLVKCRPYGSNIPSDSEYASCRHYLQNQLSIVQPKIIVTLGATAYEKFTEDSTEFDRIRGHVIDYKDYKLIPIQHPNFLLRNPSLKKDAMQDLKTIKSFL